MVISGGVQGIKEAMEFIFFVIGEGISGGEPFLECEPPESSSGPDGAVLGLCHQGEFLLESVFDEHLDVLDVDCEGDLEDIGNEL